MNKQFKINYILVTGVEISSAFALPYRWYIDVTFTKAWLQLRSWIESIDQFNFSLHSPAVYLLVQQGHG